MPKSPPDKRTVYLALKNVFKGQNAQLRVIKKIRKLILEHQHEESIHTLIAKHNIDDLCTAAKNLLEQKVFESTLKAQLHFPEDFEVSPVQSAERANSEAAAAKSEVVAIEEATKGGPDFGPFTSSHVETLRNSTIEKSSAIEELSQPRDASRHISSLYPVYLPLKSQHQLLVKLQVILERVCYDYASQHMSHKLQEEGWDSPECVELNTWMWVFRQLNVQFEDDRVAQLGKPIEEFLTSIAQVRHAAVHRIRLTAKRIEEFLIEAELLAKLLRNESQSQTLSHLRRETQSIIDELSRNKDWLEGRCREKLEEISGKRAELDRLEQVAIEEMLMDNIEYQDLAGFNLERAIAAPGTVMRSLASSDADLNSEAGHDNESFDEVEEVKEVEEVE